MFPEICHVFVRGARCSGTWRGIDSINQYYRCIILKGIHPVAGSEMERQLNWEYGKRERDEGLRPLKIPGARSFTHLFSAFVSVGVNVSSLLSHFN